MSHTLPNDVDLVGAKCMPGQLGTQADYQYPVTLISPLGTFGTSPGSIDLISNHAPNSPMSMGIVAGNAWTPFAIVATFPITNTGDGALDEEFTIVVHASGTEIEIEHVFISGPTGSGWPPTHPPTHAPDRATNREPVHR